MTSVDSRVQAVAVFSFEELTELGYSKDEAAKEVANQLTKSGVHSVTDTTVKNWQKEVLAEPEELQDKGQASKIYWKLKKLRSEASLDMSATNPDEDAHYKSFATRGVLDQLAAFVEQTNAVEDG